MSRLPEIASDVGLHLVVGPPNAGKLGVVLEWWRARSGESPVIVVPTRADVTEVELDLLERVGVVMGDAPVRSIDQFAAALRPQGPPVLGEVQRSLLLQDILADVPAGGPLHRLAGHPGAADALSALLDEIGEGGAAHEDVAATFARWAGAGGGSLARELASVYEEYAAGLARWGRSDRHGALTAAREACAGWARPVAFHGFMTFTPAQRLLVEVLAARLTVVVTLAADTERDLRGGPSEEAARLRPHAVSETVLMRQPLAYSSPAVAHLEGAFLREGSEPWIGVDSDPGDPPAGPALEGVRFLLAAGRRNEVELVAAEIVALLRSGLRPEDIGVLVRRVEPWWRAIAEVFTRYGVPHRLDGAVGFGSTGLGFALLSALRGMVESDFDLLLGFLRSPYHPISAADVDAAEVALRGGARPRGAADALESRLPGVLEVARAALKWEGEEAVGVVGEGVVALAADMLRVSGDGVEPGSPAFEQDARALAALTRSLAEIGDLDREDTACGVTTRGLAHRTFETAYSVLDRLRVTLGRGDEAGVVRVTTVRRARARRFPVVFVLGLVDGEFPGPERPPGLLGARERAMLVAPNGGPLLASERRPDDSALFALALSRPWQLLYLSGRDAEDDGGETLPSPFWFEARRLLPGVPVGPRRGLGDVVHAPEWAPTEREFLRSCAGHRLTPARGEWARLLEGLAPWACRPSRLAHPSVLGPLAARDTFSATEIEAYARCPFAWFAERAVGMATMEEELGPLQTGGVLHRVLRLVYEELREAGESRITPALLPEASARAEAALAAAIEAFGRAWPAADLELARAQLAYSIRAFLAFDAHSGSELTLAEVESNLPEGGVDLGGFRLSGRIDRIDQDPVSGAFVVVDYKSGASVHGPDFAARGALQVPLYALAYRREHPHVDAGGGVYVGLRGCRRKGAVLHEVAERAGDWFPAGARVDEEGLHAELAAALECARRAADGIRAGDIRAEPLKECPSYCSLAPLCRTPRKAASW